jgi:hypothetical protein
MCFHGLSPCDTAAVGGTRRMHTRSVINLCHPACVQAHVDQAYHRQQQQEFTCCLQVDIMRIRDTSQSLMTSIAIHSDSARYASDHALNSGSMQKQVFPLPGCSCPSQNLPVLHNIQFWAQDGTCHNCRCAVRA